MAEIKLIHPLAAIHGKLSKKDDIYYSVRHGKQIGVRLQERVDNPTDTQNQHRQRMRECNLVVNNLLTHHRDRYYQQWQDYERNLTAAGGPTAKRSFSRLRDYVYSIVYQTLKN